MDFNGIQLRFSCIDNKQFESIGLFWEFMSNIYSKESLKGLGYNWYNNSFDYVIGNLNENQDYTLPIIQKTYPDSKIVKVSLPENGWKIYSGKLDQISQIYTDIYQDGVLDYEIEEFDSIGNCTISIFRHIK